MFWKFWMDFCHSSLQIWKITTWLSPDLKCKQALIITESLKGIFWGIIHGCMHVCVHVTVWVCVIVKYRGAAYSTHSHAHWFPFSPLSAGLLDFLETFVLHLAVKCTDLDEIEGKKKSGCFCWVWFSWLFRKGLVRGIELFPMHQLPRQNINQAASSFSPTVEMSLLLKHAHAHTHLIR